MKKIIVYLQKFGYFWCWVVLRFYRDRCLTRASTLAFATLLALVPFGAVLLSVFSQMPFFANVYHTLQDFVFQNFVPSTGAVVQHYLATFSEQAEQLSVSGLVLLTFTAILMMVSIENTLNEIWRVQFTRQLSTSLLLSWGVLTLGPLLLGLSWVLSVDFLMLPFWRHVGLQHWFRGIPLAIECLGFSFFYWVVPHCHVRLLHALAGGIVATVLFEFGKSIFKAYVFYVPNYTLLYGALATVPLFLLWIYCSWLIFLLGAEVVNGLRLQAQLPTHLKLYV